MFRKADSSVYEKFLEMIDDVFPELAGYSFGLLFREKIKKSKGRMVFAEICLPTKLLSYFARNDQGNPYDFLVIFDEMVWAVSNPKDRTRIMRHELRHVLIDNNKPRLVGHDFADFYAEVELNHDDPSWAQKLGEVAMAGYDQVKSKGNDPRLDRKDADDITPVTKDPQRQLKIKEFASKIAKDVSSNLIPHDDGTSTVVNANGGSVTGVRNKKDGVKDNLTKLMEDSKKAQDRADEELASRGSITPVTRKLDDLARDKGLLPKNA